MKKIIILGSFALILALAACGGKKGARSDYDSTTNGSGAEKVLDSVYFDFDQSTIRGDQISVMKSNISTLKDKSKLKVTIEGHCDDRGTNEYNLALGDRRARASYDYLINTGIDPSRLSTISYGEERPICTQSDESCWWKNRRDDFVKGK
ncbi:MAG TPA: peptidoglycan-associated lipoprotein Pal [Deltaproteobacteria bacterium]|nr:MAG: peptidoglycan-associated lipoprotein [Deltaproteobacteria bacterium GWA2_45_12]HBF13111.1 peptidoglycan-associated lipoprotein Pal [Deltaproteobacteria bacterium]